MDIVPRTVPPAPPKVSAPHRPGAADGTDAAAAAPLTAATGGTPTASSGAQVTAVVGGAPVAGPAPVGVPTTAVPGTATGRPPDPTLARTGADTALVLVFALVAVLLGVLLVRLGAHPARQS